MHKLFGAFCSIFAALTLSSGCQEQPTISVEAKLTGISVPVPKAVLDTMRRQDETYTFANGTPTVLYVNYDGAAIKYAQNMSDAKQNISFVGGGQVPAFSGNQATRDEITGLIKQLYARYNIQVVTQRPTSGDYDMVLVGGQPGHIGMGGGTGGGGIIAGVAPMDCSNQMPRDIAFVFSESLKHVVPQQMWAHAVAETAAHESAHVYGLPHSGVGCDLMSYDNCAQLKTFLDKQMPMQSDSYGQCGLTSMNSHKMLLSTLGASTGGTGGTTAPPTTPPPAPPTGGDTAPLVKILSPANGATVPTTFALDTEVTDDSGQVVEVQVYVDGSLAGGRQAPPYNFKAQMKPGNYTITVVGFNAAGNHGQASITITVADGAPPVPTPPPTTTEPTPPAEDPTPSEPAPTAPAPPSTTPGEFGDSCQGAGDCGSKLCAQDPAVDGKYCTAVCDPDVADSCPTGSECLTANTGASVCSAVTDAAPQDPNKPELHKGSDEVSQSGKPLYGGCAVTSSAPGASGLWLLLVGLALLRRRRR